MSQEYWTNEERFTEIYTKIKNLESKTEVLESFKNTFEDHEELSWKEFTEKLITENRKRLNKQKVKFQELIDIFYLKAEDKALQIKLKELYMELNSESKLDLGIRFRCDNCDTEYTYDDLKECFRQYKETGHDLDVFECDICKCSEFSVVGIENEVKQK